MNAVNRFPQLENACVVVEERMISLSPATAWHTKVFKSLAEIPEWLPPEVGAIGGPELHLWDLIETTQAQRRTQARYERPYRVGLDTVLRTVTITLQMQVRDSQHRRRDVGASAVSSHGDLIKRQQPRL
ncbi:MAG TPA: hypothetical protein VD994_00645 [Prosthecobacter sp.]|nr:hypothetical protein [Prosthecobacter sp.]